MKTSNRGRELIEYFEGCILQTYDDDTDHIVHAGSHVGGTLTIGYGHTTAAGAPKVYVGQTITKQEADEILAGDLGRVEAEVSHLVNVPVTQNQFDALVSFHFNTGALGRSGVLAHLNKRDYHGAADALLAWVHGNGRVMDGLVRRRKAERALFLAPVVEAPATPPTPPAPKPEVVAAPVVPAPSLWGWITGIFQHKE